MNTQKNKTIFILSGLLLGSLLFCEGVIADTQLKAEKTLVYADLGDQIVNDAEWIDGRLSLSGTDITSTTKLFSNNFSIPPTSSPLGIFQWADEQKTAMKVTSAFLDTTSTKEGFYVVGSSLAQLLGKKKNEERYGVLAKFPIGASGNASPLWITRSAFFPEEKDEVFQAVMTANENNSIVIYVAGHAVGQVDNQTATLSKYNSDGKLLWSKLLGDAASMHKSGATSIALMNGFVYVAGFSSASTPDKDTKFKNLPINLTLWKYDAAGKEIWVRQAPTVLSAWDNSDDIRHGIKVDMAVAKDSLYLVSAKKNSKTSPGDIAGLKYNEKGELLWEDGWEMAALKTPRPAKNGWSSGIAVGDDRLYVAGYLNYPKKDSSGSDEDAFLLEVDMDYGVVLATHLEGKEGYFDQASAVALVGKEVYMAGTTRPETADDKKNPIGNTDVLLARYSITPALNVPIDIEPDSKLNQIDPRDFSDEKTAKKKKKKDVVEERTDIQVAIFSNPDFNAAAEVDFYSLTFGRTGNEFSWNGCSVKDVDKNGSADLLCSFKKSWTPWVDKRQVFEAGDAQGILRGQTTSGKRFIGKDAVNTGAVEAEEEPIAMPEPAPIVPLISQSPTPAPTPTPIPEPTPPAPPTPEVAPLPEIESDLEPVIEPEVEAEEEPAPMDAPVVYQEFVELHEEAAPFPINPELTPAPAIPTLTPELTTTTPPPSPPVVIPAPKVIIAEDASEFTVSNHAIPVIQNITPANVSANTSAPVLPKTTMQKNFAPFSVVIASRQAAEANTMPPTTPPTSTPPQTFTTSPKPPMPNGPAKAFQAAPSLDDAPEVQILASGEDRGNGDALSSNEVISSDLANTTAPSEASGSNKVGLAKAYGDLGKAAISKGELSKALDYYAEALKMDPGSAELRTGMGLVLARQGKISDAITYFSEALKINPADKVARENLDLLQAELKKNPA